MYRPLVGLAWAFAALILFGRLGYAPLTDLDAGAFSQASLEMLRRGDWVSPWLYDAPRFDKPVLIHWLQMISLSIFGTSSWAARLPSALAGLAWVGGVGAWAYLIAQRLCERSQIPSHQPLRAYAWAVFLSACSLGLPAMSRAATADALLNALLVNSLWMLWLALHAQTGRQARRWSHPAAALIGLGLLTKGPVAVLVPVAATFLAALAGRQLNHWFRLVTDPVAWLVLVAVAAPWYWLQFQAQGMAFVEGFLGLHNLGRFTQTMHGFSAGPLYYPIWTVIATLPLLPLLLGLVWRIWQTSRQRSGAANLAQLGRGPNLSWRTPELRLCWAVFGFVLLFFSFSATKLPHYGFYGLSGLWVLMALMLATTPQGSARLMTWSGVVSGLLVIVLIIASQLSQGFLAGIADSYYREVLETAQVHLSQQWWIWPTGVLSILLVAAAFWLRWAAVAAIGLLGLVVHVGLVPEVMQALRQPILVVGQQLANQKMAGLDRAVTWRLNAPSLSFAAGHVIAPGQPTSNSLVILHTKDLDRLKAQTACRSGSLVFERTGIAAWDCSGAGGGTRTRTPSLAPDFESGASTNSTTPAGAVR